MNAPQKPADPEGQGKRDGGQSASGDFAAIPLLERLTAGLGLALVAAVIGFMTFRSVTEEELPPDIVVTVQDVARGQGGYRVRFRVANHGTKTAAEVNVEGALKKGDETVESSQVTFDYVPPGSIRSGGLFFTQDPRAMKLDLRATGYREP